MNALPPANYIQTDDELAAAVAMLRHEPLLAVDTESNSMHAYRERVCLIQISTRSADYIIDPLCAINLAPIGDLLADPAIEKVFHAAEYDLMCLKRDYNFSVNNLFDTMIAARICGYKNVGLGTLLSEFIGVKLDKSHQRDDWGKRPLPASSLHYAQMDTHYLPDLREHFADRLAQLGLWQEARETFAELNPAPAPNHQFDPDGYWRIALPNQLTPRQTAVLRELYLLRERVAQERDVPPFKVFSDRTLAQLARAQPKTAAELSGIEGMSNGQVRRYGSQILKAIAQGMGAALPQQPPPRPPADPVVVERYSKLRDWRRQRALARGVESDVIISREALWALAEQAPTTLEALRGIHGLGPWRIEQYGEELLRVLRNGRK
ncbi:MAG: HRDC domain-containing protein [Aggregatilineales bacterium]